MDRMNKISKNERKSSRKRIILQKSKLSQSICQIKSIWLIFPQTLLLGAKKIKYFSFENLQIYFYLNRVKTRLDVIRYQLLFLEKF